MLTPNEAVYFPLSVTILNKNSLDHLRSLLTSLVPLIDVTQGDEVLVVDTGTPNCPASYSPLLADFPFLTLHSHPELCSAGMLDLVKKYLPDEAPELAADPQFDGGFLADFAAARNLCNSLARNPHIFWLDSDDVLSDAASLRQALNAVPLHLRDHAIFLNYLYSFDPDGACNTSLVRERIVPRASYTWAGVVHESLLHVPHNPNPPAARIPDDVCTVIHRHGRHHRISDIRNYVILRHALETTTSAPDPRWFLYMGNAARGLSRLGESRSFYEKALLTSGSPTDRFQCELNIATILLLQSRPWAAIDAFFRAHKILPTDPRSFYGIARCYYDLFNFPESLRWTHLGHTQPRPSNLLLAADPSSYDFYPLIYEALSLKELGDFQAALSVAEKARSLRPSLPDADALVRELTLELDKARIVSAVRTTCGLAFSHDAAADIVISLKPELRRALPQLQLETTSTPPTDSITFLCGEAPEPWDPTSLLSGIGGSEKMVILLAREFAALGFTVDVYNNPRPGNAYKSFDGVTYIPHQAFDPRRPRDTLIIWRNWTVLDAPLKANRIIMDLHDVQSPANVTPARLARLTAAVFKSNFHAAPIKDLLGDKVKILRNAIEPVAYTNANRDPRRLIFASSADRGLLRTLRLFQRIDPSLEPRLSIAYGFTPNFYRAAAARGYASFPEEYYDRHMLDYSEDCFRIIEKDPRITYHGRIPHAELQSLLLRSSALLYPTGFPEISCMTAIEAQACGCVPIVSDVGALPETCADAGVILPLHDSAAFISAAETILRADPSTLVEPRATMAAHASAAFSAKDLAQSWASLIRS